VPRQRGQVAPLVALVMVIIGVVVFGLATLGRSAVDRARAQTAADAAALAGAAADEGAARQLANANAGTLVTFERLGPDVRVVVTVGGIRAHARARRSTER
jgi:Flp pilus assembly protein TadG